MSDNKPIDTMSKSDLIASALKSVAGAVPIFGALLAEIIDNTIPNQRIDRLTRYVEQLEHKLSVAEKNIIEDNLKKQECIALIEQGFIHASQATTDERRKYIASIVANGMSSEHIEHVNSKYLLNILAELNDIEILWLRFFLNPGMNTDNEFRDKHSDVFEPIPTHFNSSDSDFDKSALQDSYKEHLERLGLIRSKIRFDRKSGLPEYDTFSGKPKISSRETTHLGKMLLREIDLFEEDSS